MRGRLGREIRGRMQDTKPFSDGVQIEDQGEWDGWDVDD